MQLYKSSEMAISNVCVLRMDCNEPYSNCYCSMCSAYEHLPTAYKCVECPLGTRPSHDLKNCTPLPEEHLYYYDVIAVVAMSLATLGMCVTTYVIHVFVKFRDTPVVRASGRELSFVLLTGILGCYAMTFVIIAPPSAVVCGTEQFGIGFFFSVCYSALLVKTNRIARIFRAGRRTAKRPRYISPRSQLVFCGALVCIQIVITTVWLFLSPPTAGHYYPTRDANQLVCLSGVGEEYVIGLAYPGVLIVVCTVYAVLTRHIPEAFNESKHVGLTMYTTCVVWLSFVPIYMCTTSRIEVRLATLCFSISISATVLLACLLAPKVYIIVLRPERNVRRPVTRSFCENTTKNPCADVTHKSDGSFFFFFFSSSFLLLLFLLLLPIQSISCCFIHSLYYAPNFL